MHLAYVDSPHVPTGQTEQKSDTLAHSSTRQLRANQGTDFQWAFSSSYKSSSNGVLATAKQCTDAVAEFHALAEHEPFRQGVYSNLFPQSCTHALAFFGLDCHSRCCIDAGSNHWWRCGRGRRN